MTFFLSALNPTMCVVSTQTAPRQECHWLLHALQAFDTPKRKTKVTAGPCSEKDVKRLKLGVNVSPGSTRHPSLLWLPLSNPKGGKVNLLTLVPKGGR